MLGILLIPLCLLIVYAVATAAGESRLIVRILMGAYAFRLLFLIIIRDVQWFTHEAGGDSVGYEMLAGLVCEYWDRNGMSYVTADQIWQVGPTTLPINLFALIMYANGGDTRAGCTAVIAMMACFTCLNFVRLARELGADPKVAERVMLCILFMPSFTMYTSDMYKDGLVVFCVIGAVGGAVRLARKFTMFDFVLGSLCLVAVWGVRYDLVFACVAPLVIGLAGFGGKSVVRPILVSAIAPVVLLMMVSYTQILQEAQESATVAFDFSYGWRAQLEGHRGGSAVEFDDGGDPTGALPQKLMYTLFAPFPWMTGSLGLNLGKVDTLLFYYFMYRAGVAAKRLFVVDKALLLTVLAFVAPMTLIYAMSVSNIGLVLRQRMPVVVMVMLLATMSWPKRETESVEGAVDEPVPDEAPPVATANAKVEEPIAAR